MRKAAGSAHKAFYSAKRLYFCVQMWYDEENKRTTDKTRFDMERLKKLLLMILAVALVFTLAVPVALGEPTDPPDDTAENPDEANMPDDGEAADTDTEAGSDFEILMLNSMSNIVVRVQERLRDLGYVNYRATGRYLSMTELGVKQFQENNGIGADGRVGPETYQTMFKNIGLVRKPLSAAEATKNTTGLDYVEGKGASAGELGDWASEIDPAFAVDSTVTITDYNTGETFEMTRTGGVGHADVEPPSADAYQKYIDCFGGNPNWEKRPVIVTIGGVNYAASLSGNAQGEDKIAENTMEGHACLYFSGSVSDVLGFVDIEHEEVVLKAAGQA
jgi:peptidoglycan hydrolase-like protein with peptidoglycan-binding domain